jgi:hypothetical protein
MNLVKIGAACVLLGAATSAGAATNLVQNGTFSATSNGLGELVNPASGGGVTTLTDWSSAGYNMVMSVADQAVSTQFGANDFSLWDTNNGGTSSWTGTAPGGLNFVALDGDFDTGALSQTVSGLTAGDVYHVTFSYAFAQQDGFTGDVSENLTMSIGSDSWTSTPDYALSSEGFSGWSTEQFTFTASSGSELLSFLAYGNTPVPPFALLSNVSIEAVPEPGVWAMLLVGVAGLGATARRRRANQLAAA